MIHPLLVWFAIILLGNGLWIRNEQQKSLVTKRLPTKLFHEGERINLYVNKLTTTKRFLYPPIDYYRLVPYNLHRTYSNNAITTAISRNYEYETNTSRIRRTKFENGTEYISNNNDMEPMSIGQIRKGDCIRTLPTISYISVGTNQDCMELGSVFIDEEYYQTIWKSVITSSYYHNWFVDISGSRTDNTTQRQPYNDTSRFLNSEWINKKLLSSTFPVGSNKIHSDGTKDLAIHNHFRIVFKYKSVRTIPNTTRSPNDIDNTKLPETLYQITDLIIQPSSQINYDDSNLKSMIPHCRMQPSKVIPTFGISYNEQQNHDATDLLIARGKSWKIQRPNGTVLFTYDSHWIPDNTSEKQYKQRFLHQQKEIRKKLIWMYLVPILAIESLLLCVFLYWWKTKLDHHHQSCDVGSLHQLKWAPKSLIRNTNRSRRIVEESISPRQWIKISSFLRYILIVYSMCSGWWTFLEQCRLLSAFCGFCVECICASLIILLVVSLFGRSFIIDNELKAILSLVLLNHIGCAFLQGFITSKLDHKTPLVSFSKKSWDSVAHVSGPSMAVLCILALFAKVFELYTIRHVPLSCNKVDFIIPYFQLLVYSTLNIFLSVIGARTAIQVEASRNLVAEPIATTRLKQTNY